MTRVLELILQSLRARASYSTRVWNALLLPVVTGTVFGWPTRMKFEGLVLGVLVAAFYTLFQLVRKKYLK